MSYEPPHVLSAAAYVTQAFNLILLMLPPSCSGEGLKSLRPGPTLPAAALTTLLLLLFAPLPPPPPVSSRSLPSKELALLLTLSAGERPVGGSRHRSEPGYWGGAVRVAPEDGGGGGGAGGGQGVLRSWPGDTGSDLMLMPLLVLTVNMAP